VDIETPTHSERWIDYSTWRMEVLLNGEEFDHVVVPNIDVRTHEGLRRVQFLVSDTKIKGFGFHNGLMVREFKPEWEEHIKHRIYIRDVFDSPEQLGEKLGCGYWPMPEISIRQYVSDSYGSIATGKKKARYKNDQLPYHKRK